MGKAKKVLGGGSKKSDNSAAIKAMQEANNVRMANESNKAASDKQNAANADASMQSTMLTNQDGSVMMTTGGKKKTLLGSD